eukprot:m.157356 g.157356  ORF g.157356 m.157356 type:complete len:1099 (-) comp15115_c1_seq3:280-3576(-)
MSLSDQIVEGKRQQKKLEKQLKDVNDLEAKQKQGTKLETNQISKIAKKNTFAKQLQDIKEKVRSLLIEGDETIREQHGACTNCGVEGHKAENCPRPSSKKSAQINKRTTSAQKPDSKADKSTRGKKRNEDTNSKSHETSRQEGRGSQTQKHKAQDRNRGNGRGRTKDTNTTLPKGMDADDAASKKTELERMKRKIHKDITKIKQYQELQSSGKQLEANQIRKLATLSTLEKEAQEIDSKIALVLRQASTSARAQLGVCEKCGLATHTSAQCPRTKAIVEAAEQADIIEQEKPDSTTDNSNQVNANIVEVVSSLVLPRGGVVDTTTTNTSITKGLPKQASSKPKEHREAAANVLCIAEKPSVAKAIATALSNGKMRTRNCGKNGRLRCHDCFYHFSPVKDKCAISITSVVGHLFGLDFDEDSGVDPVNLFGAHTRKTIAENTTQFGVLETLITLSENADYLYLWLDCDREGENICYEVISVLRGAGLFLDDDKIFRAEFSSLAPTDIKRAFMRPGKPCPAKAHAVDARQELDLKIGCSFTRLFTRQFLEGARATFSDSALSVISYGPCQTPTLRFCVERWNEIEAFVCRDYWEIASEIRANGQVLKGLWSKKRTFRESEARDVAKKLSATGPIKGVVSGCQARTRRVAPPTGLNTVALLQACAKTMGMSPHKIMEIAEQLYMAGYISYPRTESTAYSRNFDFHTICEQHTKHPLWGDVAQSILNTQKKDSNGKLYVYNKKGHDAGDHPPISPTAYCTRSQIKNEKAFRMYELVCRCFFATLLPEFTYNEKEFTFNVKGTLFTYKQAYVTQQGWTQAMPWRKNEILFNLQNAAITLKKGDEIDLIKCEITKGRTEPPLYLKEHELVGLMDKHGIGTDASIPQHIQTIVDRQYVSVVETESDNTGNNSGKGPIHRLLVPTPLGLALVGSLQEVASSLITPSLRSTMEQQLVLIAEGKMSKTNVMDENLAKFLHKYDEVVTLLPKMRPHFISEKAVEAFMTSSKWTTVDDRVTEAKADVASQCVSDAEKERLRKDRMRVQAKVSLLSEEEQIKAAFFTGGHHHHDDVPTFYKNNNLPHMSQHGLKHCQGEVQRLRSLANTLT